MKTVLTSILFSGLLVTSIVTPSCSFTLSISAPIHAGNSIGLAAFPNLSVRLSTFTTTSSSSRLMAKKAGKKGSATKGAYSGGGDGFASATSKALNSQQRKTRSLSTQHSPGAGTKPLRAAANAFDKIRQEFGKYCTSDVYCRSPDNDIETFWFVGKVAVRPATSATPDQAVISQKRLILEYAKSELRPQNFAGRYASTLELWLAPGDSEMDAVQNKVSLTKVDGSMSDLVDDFNVNDVGFNPEIYVGDERQNGGLRIKRDEKGNPIKPVFEVNQSM